jgi:enoyl-CoA hydratase/carnithine racemase
MAAEVLFEEAEPHVAVVTLNRPEKRNAVNAAVAAGLEAAVERSEADPGIRAVILASSNDQVYCAGADLAAVAAGEGRGISTPGGGFAGFVRAARTKPWIAAVRGKALAGGCELALACDMIVASDDATFGLPEPKRGLVAGAGGSTRLVRALPRHVAIELIVTGDSLDAGRAHQLGLVNWIVPSDEVLGAALDIARRISRNAPIAVKEALGLARRAADLTDEEAMAATEEAMARVRRTEDFKEGPRAFVEKREPVWQGR